VVQSCQLLREPVVQVQFEYRKLYAIHTSLLYSSRLLIPLPLGTHCRNTHISETRGVLCFPIIQTGSWSFPKELTAKTRESQALSFLTPGRSYVDSPRDSIILNIAQFHPCYIYPPPQMIQQEFVMPSFLLLPTQEQTLNPRADDIRGYDVVS
jgi:hypothetical protein